MSSHPAHHLDHTLDGKALRAVNRAFGELRRGDPVIVETPDHAVTLAQPAEGVTAESLARLEFLAETPPVLVLSRRRAAVIGFAGTGDGVIGLRGPLTIERIRDLVDPTRGAPLVPADRELLRIEPATEPEAAAVQLAKLAQLLPAMLVAPLPDPLGNQGPALAAFAQCHDLLRVKAGDIAHYHSLSARSLLRVVEAVVPLDRAETTRLIAFRPSDGGLEHLAIIIGDPAPGQIVLTRLHSECFTGDLLGSLRCDCGAQLRGAIDEIIEHGQGILLYLAQEGRGIGLINKLRAYRLQDDGADTIDANVMLGFDADERLYLPAAEMLRLLGFQKVRLLTNNPDKLRQLARCGIDVVERVPHIFPSNGHNEAYLRTKAERAGHLF
ncbi:MAG: GTP cyclohydrolase II [Azospirillaceae bacterium]|nr:GTP cyclohydrolase II [Azospirillaceae bacterium]